MREYVSAAACTIPEAGSSTSNAHASSQDGEWPMFASRLLDAQAQCQNKLLILEQLICRVLDRLPDTCPRGDQGPGMPAQPPNQAPAHQASNPSLRWAKAAPASPAAADLANAQPPKFTLSDVVRIAEAKRHQRHMSSDSPWAPPGHMPSHDIHRQSVPEKASWPAPQDGTSCPAASSQLRVALSAAAPIAEPLGRIPEHQAHGLQTLSLPGKQQPASTAPKYKLGFSGPTVSAIPVLVAAPVSEPGPPPTAQPSAARGAHVAVDGHKAAAAAAAAAAAGGGGRGTGEGGGGEQAAGVGWSPIPCALHLDGEDVVTAGPWQALVSDAVPRPAGAMTFGHPNPDPGAPALGEAGPGQGQSIELGGDSSRALGHQECRGALQLSLAADGEFASPTEYKVETAAAAAAAAGEARARAGAPSLQAMSRDLSSMSLLSRIMYTAARDDTLRRQERASHTLGSAARSNDSDSGRSGSQLDLPRRGLPCCSSALFKAPAAAARRWRWRPVWKLSVKWFMAAFWDVCDHDDPRRMVWDILLLVTATYLVFITPYLIAFGVSTVKTNSPIAILDLTINGILLFDVYVNFRTAYQDEEGHLVLSHRRIARRYASGWMCFDVLSSLPYDNMFQNERLSALKLPRLLRIPRILRILRGMGSRNRARGKAANVVQLVEQSLGKSNFGMLRTFMLAVSVLHWTACLFYFTASWSQFDDNTWVYVYGLDSAPYVKRYIWSFYWAVVTMATVGYGDIVPVSTSEHMVTIATIFVGTSLFAYVMGSIASNISASDSVSAALVRKTALVEEFLSHRNIPSLLSDKVRNYYNYTVVREVQSEEQMILEGLPRSLQLQLVAHLYSGVLDKIPMFRDRRPQFIACLVPLFKLECYSPDDVVVRQGHVGHEMYFVVEGQLEVRVYSEEERVRGPPGRELNGGPGPVMPKPKPRRWWQSKRQKQRAAAAGSFDMGLDLSRQDYTTVGTLSAGDHFGWHSCMLRHPRASTIVTLDFCELYCLRRADLEDLVTQWPELIEDLSSLVVANTTELEDAAWEVRRQLGLPDLYSLMSGLNDPGPGDAGSESSQRPSASAHHNRTMT